MPRLLRRSVGLFAACWLASCLHGAGTPEVAGSRAMLHLNGYTHHFNARGANDNLLGLGLTLYDGRAGRVTKAWEGDAFLDSGRQFSGYIGRSWTMPLAFGNVGVTAALMYHRNFLKQNNLGVLPVGLPYWETNGRGLRVRLYYIPGMRSTSDQQIAVQLLTPLRRLVTRAPRAGSGVVSRK